MDNIATVPLLAAAYLRPQWNKNRKFLTHAALLGDDGEPVRILCGKVQLDSVCDAAMWTTDEPTCPQCAARLKKLRRTTPCVSQ